MKNRILDKISKCSNIAIVGFGKEGKSTYKFIRSKLKDIKLTIIDKVNAYEMLDELNNDKNIDVVYGDNYLDNLDRFDLIFKSPGVSFKELDRDSLSKKITSQIEMVLEEVRDRTIAVTGSKGKSTTSSLIHHLIKCQDKKTVLVGNIGVPVFDEVDNYTEDTIIVMETSCNQLEFVDVSPHIGVIVNIYQDHLDTIGTLERYENAKMNMFLYQNENDFGIYDKDNKTINRKLKEMSIKSKLFNVSLESNADCYLDGDMIFLDNKELVNKNDIKRNILGDHNLKNIMMALKVIDILGLDVSKAINDIESFYGLEHRMERVGVFKDITFFNDTIATIPEATILACSTINDLDTLIFGGQDRGIDYGDFVKYLNESSISNFICMPTTGYKLSELLDNSKHNVYKVETLEEAVKKAYEVTKKNRSCLLSPAAASYEAFKNFEEKGRKYKEYIDLYK